MTQGDLSNSRMVWEQTAGPAVEYLSSLDQPYNVFITRDENFCGVYYGFSLSVDENNLVGAGSLRSSVMPPPQGVSVKTKHVKGSGLNAVYELLALGWMHDDDELMPLSYQLYRVQGFGADEIFTPISGATYSNRFRFQIIK